LLFLELPIVLRAAKEYPEQDVKRLFILGLKIFFMKALFPEEE